MKEGMNVFNFVLQKNRPPKRAANRQIILKYLKASFLLIPVLYPVVVLSLDTHVEIYLRLLKFVAQQNDSLCVERDNAVNVRTTRE